MNLSFTGTSNEVMKFSVLELRDIFFGSMPLLSMSHITKTQNYSLVVQSINQVLYGFILDGPFMYSLIIDQNWVATEPIIINMEENFEYFLFVNSLVCHNLFLNRFLLTQQSSLC